ncbi:MAG: cupin domain-containing protein [Armatimonadetes bacterium]|nr:cupin domain-containing protein [Armatimonadota bacterium]
MAHQIKNLLEMINMPKDGILSIAVEDNEHYKVVLFMMPEGQYLSPHTSTMPATVQILQGKADFTLGEETYEVKPGDHFYMPPNFNHAIRAKEDFVFLLNLNR